MLTRWVRGFKDEKDLHVIPTDTLYLNIDKEAVMRSGMMLPKDSAGNVLIPERMAISLAGRRALYKGDLMLLEMLANHNWERPLYVAQTVGADNYMNLGEHFVQEGLVNRITPFHTNLATNFDSEKVYNNMMTRFKYGGLEKEGLYLDETVSRMVATHRRLFGALITRLLSEGKNEKALKAIEYAEKVIPTYNLPMRYMNGGLDFIDAYYVLGQTAKAEKIMTDMWTNSVQYLNWYFSLSQSRFFSSKRECMMNFFVLQNLLEIARENNSKSADAMSKQFYSLMEVYQGRGGSFE